MQRREGFDVRLDRAHRLLMADRFDEALAALVALRARRPRHEQVLSDIGTVHLLTGRWREAIEVLEECVAEHQGSVEPRLQLARGLWASGRRDDAMRHADEALRVDPGSADALEARGMLRLRGGDPAGALADLERAETLDPRNALVPAFLGAAQLALGRPGAAEPAFARALALDPDQTTAIAGSAILRLRGGDASGADALLARIARYADDAAPLVAEARAARRATR
jgi:Flp pilus assembly protein TadD